MLFCQEPVDEPEKDYHLPKFSIRNNGTAVAEDGEALSPLCAARYTTSMESQATAMAVQVDAIIGSELCQDRNQGDLLITTVSVFTSFDQEKVHAVISKLTRLASTTQVYNQ